MAKLKILHFSDVHDDYEQLENLKKYANQKGDINLILCSGDILGPCLNGPQAQESHKSLELILEGYGKPVKSMEDLQSAFKKGANSSDSRIKNAVVSYLHLEDRFNQISMEKYKRFEEQIRGFKQQVLTVPGNWDTPAAYSEVLKDCDFHGAVGKIGDFVLAGYGGANSIPKYMPPLNAMSYRDEDFEKFLKKVSPDILVSHMPPKNILDGQDKIGSEALERYIKSKNPKLVLCGHNHQAGYKKVGQTTVVNSGNFGKYFNQKSRGTFSEIEIDGDEVKVTQYRFDEKGNAQKI